MFVKYYYYTYMTTIFMPDFSQVLDFPQFNLNNGGELRIKLDVIRFNIKDNQTDLSGIPTGIIRNSG